MKKINGSLTVEAALIFPITLGLLVLTLHTGIDLYQESVMTAVSIREEKKINTVKLFERRKILEGTNAD